MKFRTKRGGGTEYEVVLIPPGLKYPAASAAARFGIAIARTTRKEDLFELLRKLYPVTTELPLIRLGCDGDGGYLVPDDLEGIAACFSPGVEDRASFEEDLLKRGIRCHLADGSVERNPLDSSDSTFVRKNIDVVTTDCSITIGDWIEELEPGGSDLLLQMDIEGAEWPVLLNISDKNLSRFRIIVIELHDMERLLDKNAFRIMQAMLSRLTEKFHVVHIHPNNYVGTVKFGQIAIPSAVEITLLRRDRSTKFKFATHFPHPLDQANSPRRSDIVLPPCWYAR